MFINFYKIRDPVQYKLDIGFKSYLDPIVKLKVIVIEKYVFTTFNQLICLKKVLQNNSKKNSPNI